MVAHSCPSSPFSLLDDSSAAHFSSVDHILHLHILGIPSILLKRSALLLISACTFIFLFVCFRFSTEEEVAAHATKHIHEKKDTSFTHRGCLLLVIRLALVNNAHAVRTIIAEGVFSL